MKRRIRSGAAAVVRLAWRCLVFGWIAGLVLLFALQSFVVYQLARHGELVIPASVAEYLLVSKAVEMEGHRWRVGDIRLVAGGKVSVSEVVLEIERLRLPLIEFHEVTGTLIRSGWRRPSLDLTLADGRLSDGESPVIRGLEVEISIRDGAVRDVYASGRHRLASLGARGRFVPTRVRRERVSLAHTLGGIYEGIRAFENATVYLISAEGGHLDVALDNQLNPSATPRIEMAFQADRVRGLYGVLIEPQVVLSNDPLPIRRQGAAERWQFDGRMTQMRLPFFGVRANDLQLSGEITSGATPGWAMRIEADELFHGLQTLRETALTISTEPSMGSGGVLAMLRTRLNERSLIEVETRFSTVFEGAEASVRGTIDPGLALEHALIAPFLEHPQIPVLGFGQPLRISGKVALDAGMQLRSADLYFHTESVSIDEIQVDFIAGRAATDGTLFELADVYVQRDDLHGWAGARYSLETGEYLVALKGRIDPVEIGYLVGSWWESIFNPFDFTDQGDSWADFIIRGHTKRNRPDYFFGEVRAERVSYYGMPMERGRLRVRGSPWFVELYDFEAKAEAGGSLEGYLAWEIEPQSGTGPRTHWIRLDGSIEPTALSSLLAEAGIGEASRWVGAFEIAQPARVFFDGRFHNPELAYPGDHNFFKLLVEVDQPLRFEGLPMENLSFDFTYGEDRQTLRDGRMLMADGEVFLEFDRYPEPDDIPQREGGAGDDEKAHLRFNVRVEDALRGAASEILEHYLASRRAEGDARIAATVTPPDGPGADTEGRFDLVLSVEGPEGVVDRMSGVGSFTLRDPGLATVPVLGPVSRILDGTPFNFTSLRLEKLVTDFYLESGELSFPKMKITGPVAIVDANGLYRLTGGDLDFRIRVRPVGQLVETPSPLRRLGEMLLPLPGLMEGDVTGTLENPRWRSAYDPRSWLFQRD